MVVHNHACVDVFERERDWISVFVFFECPVKPLPRKLVYIGMLYMYVYTTCMFVCVGCIRSDTCYFQFCVCYFAPLIVECKTVNGLINCFCLSPKLLTALFAVFPIIFDNCFTIDIPAATLPAWSCNCSRVIFYMECDKFKVMAAINIQNVRLQPFLTLQMGWQNFNWIVKYVC